MLKCCVWRRLSTFPPLYHLSNVWATEGHWIEGIGVVCLDSSVPAWLPVSRHVDSAAAAFIVVSLPLRTRAGHRNSRHIQWKNSTTYTYFSSDCLYYCKIILCSIRPEWKYRDIKKIFLTHVPYFIDSINFDNIYCNLVMGLLILWRW